MEKILVTGGAGYIGSVLVRRLLDVGYFVRVFDCLRSGDGGLKAYQSHPSFELFQGDLRRSQEVEQALEGIDHVVHLAAIVGDPACSKEPELAEEVNWRASKTLLDLSIRNGVKRFVFSSTCSNYGKMGNDSWVKETSPLCPVSHYARLKVKFEQFLLEKKVPKSFCPVVLRFSTAYGFSPRMRFDLTVNEFIAYAVAEKEILIYGKEFWRPYCHVEDLSNACMLALTTPTQKVRGQVFNVGETRENYQKRMIAEVILKQVPTAQIRYVEKEEDPRDYRVDFSKIQSVLNFKIGETVPDGVREIKTALQNGSLQLPKILLAEKQSSYKG